MIASQSGNVEVEAQIFLKVKSSANWEALVLDAMESNIWAIL